MAWLVLAPLLAWLILFTVIVPTIMLVLLSLGEQRAWEPSISLSL